VPSFQPSASPELDETFTTLRQQYFVPTHLNRQQRKMIYKPKFKGDLETKPTFATLGGEDFRLEHVNPRRDLTPPKKLVSKAVQLMRETGDFKNLPSFLEGLHAMHKTPLKRHEQEALVRLATRADQFSAVLQCLRDPKKYDLSLMREGILNRVMWGLHSTGQAADWAEASVKRAIRYGDTLAEILEQGVHTGTTRVLAENDPRTNPAVIGVYLELAAVNASKYHEGKDEDGSVEKYAVRLMECLQGYEEVRLHGYMLLSSSDA